MKGNGSVLVLLVSLLTCEGMSLKDYKKQINDLIMKHLSYPNDRDADVILPKFDLNFDTVEKCNLSRLMSLKYRETVNNGRIRLVEYMKEIDGLIVKRLTDPHKKFRDDIFPDMNLYNINLHNVIVAFQKQRPNYTEIAKAVYNEGMPQFLVRRERFNYSQVLRVFEWEEPHLVHLSCTFNETESLWAQLMYWCIKYNTLTG